MGFESENAIYALKKTQYQSEDRAVSFLSDKDRQGKFEHEFIGFGLNKELCKLCMGSAAEHLPE